VDGEIHLADRGETATCASPYDYVGFGVWRCLGSRTESQAGLVDREGRCHPTGRAPCRERVVRLDSGEVDPPVGVKPRGRMNSAIRARATTRPPMKRSMDWSLANWRAPRRGRGFVARPRMPRSHTFAASSRDPAGWPKSSSVWESEVSATESPDAEELFDHLDKVRSPASFYARRMYDVPVRRRILDGAKTNRADSDDAA
jgi:hypothetical protein